MFRQPSRRGALTAAVATGLVVLLAGAATFVFFNRSHPAAKRPSTLSRYCVGQTFGQGDSGGCVEDIQTLTGYVYSRLNELPSCTEPAGSAAYTIKTTGTFDAADAGAVRQVQSWARCYASQEGFTSNVKITGSVDRSTWGELCTYGYADPLHTQAKNANAAIAAGKDAGCARLQS